MADFHNGQVSGLGAFFEKAPAVPALSIYTGTAPTFASLKWDDGSAGNTCTTTAQFRVKYLCEGQCSDLYRFITNRGIFLFSPGQEQTISLSQGNTITRIDIRKQAPSDQYRAVFDWYYEDDLIDRMFIEVATTALNRPPGGVFDPSRFNRLLADEPELSDRSFPRLAPLEAGPTPSPKQELLFFQAVDFTDRNGEVFSFMEGAGDFTHPRTGRAYRGGVVADVTAVTNDTDTGPQEMSITVSGVQAELAALSRFDDYQYAEARLWMFGLNQRAQTLEGEWLRYRGFISHADFTQDEGGKAITITFHLTTRISDPDKQLIPRISSEYQKTIDPEDTAFDKIVEQANKETTWGRGEIRGYPQSEKNY